MNVTTEDLRKIKPGSVQPFVCEDGGKMRSACSLISILKQTGFPDGIVGYETKKFFADENDGVNIILIHAMREGDERVLNV